LAQECLACSPRRSYRRMCKGAATVSEAVALKGENVAPLTPSTPTRCGGPSGRASAAHGGDGWGRAHRGGCRGRTGRRAMAAAVVEAKATLSPELASSPPAVPLKPAPVAEDVAVAAWRLPTPVRARGRPNAHGADRDAGLAGAGTGTTETAPVAPSNVDDEGAVSDLRKSRKVQFDLDACSVHEITPYSEVYGVHPRDFVFDKRFCMIPAVHYVPVDVLAANNWRWRSPALDEEDCDYSDDSDEDSEWC